MPHIADRRGGDPDDLVLATAEVAALLDRFVVVEEKLDGANITLWVDDGVPRAAARGGAGSSDRARILGPVRGWAMQRADVLRDVLGDHHAVYGEWLLRRHVVPYTSLPGPFVGFDSFNRAAGEFDTVRERDDLLRAAGIPLPPRLFEGRVRSLAHLRSLHERSRFGEEAAEGLIVRSRSAPRAVAKLLDPRWSDAGSAGWSSDAQSNAVGTTASISSS